MHMDGLTLTTFLGQAQTRVSLPFFACMKKSFEFMLFSFYLKMILVAPDWPIGYD